jgi:hypothetical protein
MSGKHKTRLPGVCRNCGEVFSARSYYIRTGVQQFCGRKCSQTGKFNGNYRGGKASSEYIRTTIKRFPERHKCRRKFIKAVKRGEIAPRSEIRRREEAVMAGVDYS